MRPIFVKRNSYPATFCDWSGKLTKREIEESKWTVVNGWCEAQILRAAHYRLFRDRAFAQWGEVTCVKNPA